MEVGGRSIEGVLEEREQARRDYDQAIAAGHRAAIAEEERPNVFTLRVGNLMPGEEATVHLELAGVLPYSVRRGHVPLPAGRRAQVHPGSAAAGHRCGDGTAADTDAVPDASRISPPVLLPGFPNPVRLSLTVDLHDHNGTVSDRRTSDRACTRSSTEEKGGFRRVRLDPGDRLDRDFILRFRLGSREASGPSSPRSAFTPTRTATDAPGPSR